MKGRATLEHLDVLYQLSQPNVWAIKRSSARSQLAVSSQSARGLGRRMDRKYTHSVNLHETMSTRKLKRRRYPKQQKLASTWNCRNFCYASESSQQLSLTSSCARRSVSAGLFQRLYGLEAVIRSRSHLICLAIRIRSHCSRRACCELRGSRRSGLRCSRCCRFGRSRPTPCSVRLSSRCRTWRQLHTRALA